MAMQTCPYCSTASKAGTSGIFAAHLLLGDKRLLENGLQSHQQFVMKNLRGAVSSDRGHVFIVDDDASSADTLQELLEGDGYTVGSASRGKEALKGIASAEPNLVLLDAHLAEVDPFELLEELKKTQHGRDIPVIFMTTLEDADARVKVLDPKEPARECCSKNGGMASRTCDSCEVRGPRASLAPEIALCPDSGPHNALAVHP